MGEPYRYKKSLVKIGNSYYVNMPANWLFVNKKKFANKDPREVDMEVTDEQICITPAK